MHKCHSEMTSVHAQHMLVDGRAAMDEVSEEKERVRVRRSLKEEDCLRSSSDEN